MDSRNINPRFRPRSANARTVSISEIIPGAGKKVNLREMKNKQTAAELNTGVKRAMKRFVNQLIEPQKEVMINAMIDSQINNEKLTAYDLASKIASYNNRITNAMAKGADGFNMVRAQADLADALARKQQIIANGGQIDDNKVIDDLMNGQDNLFETETIFIPSDYNNRTRNGSPKKITSMDDVFEDQIYVSPGTDDYVKIVDNNKDDDSIPIDPSMLMID